VAKHHTDGDCWSVFFGRVYFVTPFARFHPGGIPDLMKAAGVDGSEMFAKFVLHYVAQCYTPSWLQRHHSPTCPAPHPREGTIAGLPLKPCVQKSSSHPSSKPPPPPPPLRWQVARRDVQGGGGVVRLECTRFPSPSAAEAAATLQVLLSPLCHASRCTSATHHAGPRQHAVLARAHRLALLPRHSPLHPNLDPRPIRCGCACHPSSTCTCIASRVTRHASHAAQAPSFLSSNQCLVDNSRPNCALPKQAVKFVSRCCFAPSLVCAAIARARRHGAHAVLWDVACGMWHV
jgi:hypothetical protein